MLKRFLDTLELIFSRPAPARPATATLTLELVAPVDLSKIAVTYLSQSDVREIIRTALNSDERTLPFDKHYLGYPESQIRAVYEKNPPPPRQEEAMAEFEKQFGISTTDMNDCDDRAEWRARLFRIALPYCAAIQLNGYRRAGGAHRFCGVATEDNRIIWFGGNPADWDFFKHIIY